MKFLGDINSENIMPINILYHYPKKQNNYKDYLDIIYKDLKTGEKHLKTIEEPEMEIYFAKEEYRNYNYNKNFLEIPKTEMHKCKFRNMHYYIANQAGDMYKKYIEKCRERKDRFAMNNIHKFKYVFGSDYDIENWYKIQWILNYDNNKEKPITQQFLDIEADTIDIEGFPKPGECPINAVTIIDEKDLSAHTFLLRNDKNPLIQEFENDIENFIEELHQDFDDFYGKLDYNFYMYDDELKMITDLFKLINTLKRDFLMIWNMGFDIPYIIERIRELGGTPEDIMCHKDFKVKELMYRKDTKNFKIENKSDYFKISSYTTFLDQMLLYAGLRKGASELRSHALNYIAKVELKDEKLDYSEESNLKELPYKNYKKFVKYNIKDTLLQLGISRKTKDIHDIYERAYSNATAYHKIFKQTVFLKNRAYIEFFKQGTIIGNNINSEYTTIVNNTQEDDEEDEKFDGALVADPMLNSHTGINIFGKPSMFIFDLVIDEDFGSMYPNIIITFNVAPNSLIGKLVVDKDIQELQNIKEINNDHYDAGKEFVDNLLTKNIPMIGNKWFNLPNMETLNTLIRNQFNINSNITKINLQPDDVNKYFLEGVFVNINN